MDPLLTALQSQTEFDLLQKVLVPLFSALGYQRVTLEGGTHESGRDLVCWGVDEFGEPKIVVVHAKRFQPNARTQLSQSLMTLLPQLDQALETALVLPDGSKRLPTAAIFVTPFSLNQQTLYAVSSGLAERHRRRTTIIDGVKLAELISQHLPALALRLSSDCARAQQAPYVSPSPVAGHRSESDLVDFLAALRTDIDRRIAPAEPIDSQLCFVIMSFSANPVLSDFYEKAIKTVAENLGYRCERIDEQQFNGRITERIFHNLRTARLVIADITEARPNCYYELGIAHALRKEVIHLAYAGKDIHFDVKDWNFIIYSRIDELASALRERILGTAGRCGPGPDRAYGGCAHHSPMPGTHHNHRAPTGLPRNSR